ncbi:MAG: ACP S-malonyltransferase [Chitinophagaceae bacterium]|nr:ACP S-malonyltransferase [Chitinophagaceae bacterium]
MKTSYIFPGQASQFPGMGKEIYEKNARGKELFLEANEILGFNITDIMFYGSAEELKHTKITQTSVFIHSVISYMLFSKEKASAVAGHSLGEFSALVANKCLSYRDALHLVNIRANAMQQACERNPSTMAVVLGLSQDKIETICSSITDEVVVLANYNSPEQLVISGSLKGIELATDKLKNAGAKRVLPIAVGGAFHSPLMSSAKLELADAIGYTRFSTPECPIYQNVNANMTSNVKEIQQNLIDQLTAPVKWSQTIQNMVDDGIDCFIECGPGKVLQGLVSRIDSKVSVKGINYDFSI